MFKPIFILICILFYISSTLYAEEDTTQIQSLKNERLETIRYGIDTQVIELIKQLKTEKNFEFNGDLLELLKTSVNNKLDLEIINLLNIAKDGSAVEYIFKELKEDFNLSDDSRVSYIKYLSYYQNTEITEYLQSLIDEKNNNVSIASIAALGKSKLDSSIPKLLNYLKDPLIDNLRKPAIIEALGNLKATEALEILTDIATDPDSESKSIRWKAVIALGQIGSPDSFPVIKSLFSDNDPFLRNYAISALKNYPREEIEPLLIQALKDSSWRVRVTASNTIGELRLKDAVPILIYKCKNDPDIRNVRTAALHALGEVGSNTAYDYIKKLYKNEKSNSNLRRISIDIIVEKDLTGSLKLIETVMENEWDKTDSILDYTCKVLSTTKSSSLTKIYKKMLTYNKTLNLKIYALRGIKLNSISSLKDQVESLATGNTPNAVKKLAIDVLKEL